MLAKLSYALIATTPKKGMIVEMNNELFQIKTYINSDTIDIDCISLEDGITQKSFSYQDVCNNICKFIATYKSKDRECDCSICHTSLNLLVSFLDEKDEAGVDNWSKLRNREELIIKGEIEPILTAVKPGMTVQITEIGIIDKYKLYEPSNRICTIKSVNKLDCVIYNNYLNTTINCRRKHFRNMENDLYYMFYLKCDMCNR